MVLLFLPKLLRFCLFGAKERKNMAASGALHFVAAGSAVFRAAGSGTHAVPTVFVVSAFLGWEVVWNSPQRMMTPLPGVKRSNATAHSCCWVSVGCWDGVVGSAFPVLAGPIVFSLILSPFVSVISSRATLVCAPNAGNCS